MYQNLILTNEGNRAVSCAHANELRAEGLDAATKVSCMGPPGKA
jgi:hypothetical protein